MQHSHCNCMSLPDILIFRKDNYVSHPLMTENGGNIKKKQCFNHVKIFSSALQQNWHLTHSDGRCQQ